MENIEKLNKQELEDLLKNLRTYKDLMKKVWKRGKKIYDNVFNWKNEYVVEYFDKLDSDYVLKEALEIYNKVFWVKVSDSEVKLVENPNVKGGMKVYLNDNLVDLSFLKFYNILKK